MIKLQVIGNLGKDAILTEVSGRKAINFSIAQNEKYKDQDGNPVEKTIWVSCTLWKENGQNTKVIEYLKKGSKVFIDGKPDVKVYKNKDGKYVSELRVNVSTLELITTAKEETDQDTE